jgi:hypothetical protein
MKSILQAMGTLQKQMLLSSSDRTSFGESAFPITKERLDKVEEVNVLSPLEYFILLLVNARLPLFGLCKRYVFG